MSTTRTTSDFGDFGFGDLVLDNADFGDRKKKGAREARYPFDFGNVNRGGKKLKRPYKRAVVRKGRKLVAAKKIGHVERSSKKTFVSVTRGGSVWERSVSKKGAREAPKKAKKAAKRAKARKAPKRGGKR